jgi:hypothetical protein
MKARAGAETNSFGSSSLAFEGSLFTEQFSKIRFVSALKLLFKR